MYIWDARAGSYQRYSSDNAGHQWLLGDLAAKAKPKRAVDYIAPATVFATAYQTAQRFVTTPGIDIPTLARITTSIAKHESTFDRFAKNPASTARGLMQILIGTQKAIEKRMGLKHQPDKIWEIPYAIMLAENELGYQWKRYGGNWDKTIHAYNQGSWPTNLKAGTSYKNAVWNNYRTLPWPQLERDAGVA